MGEMGYFESLTRGEFGRCDTNDVYRGKVILYLTDRGSITWVLDAHLLARSHTALPHRLTPPPHVLPQKVHVFHTQEGRVRVAQTTNRARRQTAKDQSHR